MVEWNEDLDLAEFYAEAGRRGHVNNASQKVMVDCFRNEKRYSNRKCCSTYISRDGA